MTSRMRVALLLASASAFALGSVAARAQDAGATALEQIDVIGTTPIGGDGLDRDKVPANVQTIDGTALRNYNNLTPQEGLQRQVPSFNVSDVTGNPFNKEIQFRGYQSGGLVGVPQGLAVYQNGVRVNESFGDTVNYDFIPQVAIDSTDLWTNNPVFGLNALGGALSFKTKNGFTFQGVELEGQVGSFGRYQGSSQWGTQVGPWAAYIALEGARDGGWRDFSESKLRRFFGDIGYKTDTAEIHLNATYAKNSLGVVGPTPLELLDQRRRNVYTGDQVNENEMGMLNLSGKFELPNDWSLEANAYYRKYKRDGVDGNDTEARPCPGQPQFMCLVEDDDDDDGGNNNNNNNDDDIDPRRYLRDPVTGKRVRNPGFPAEDDDFGPGSTPGSIERSRTRTDAAGATLQASNDSDLFGLKNHFVVGATYDYGKTDFKGWSELCIIPANLQCIGTGQEYYTTIPGGIIPVDVIGKNQYVGVYATDTLDLTDKWSVTAGARFNFARVELEDRRTIFPLRKNGTRADQSLDGTHDFTRLNPMVGMTYKFTPEITGFASYAETNRAPTPLELACADENVPCPLEATLVSDPPLKQVITRTAEAGFRGRHSLFDGVFAWSASAYRGENTNDIFQVASQNITGRGFFVDAGKTRRQGVELTAQYYADKWAIYANYSYIDATFRKNIILNSNSPAAGEDGLPVRKGDKLTGIPDHQFKLGGSYRITPQWTVGADMMAYSSQYVVGDESNDFSKLKGYAVVDVNTSYQITNEIKVFGGIKNVFDKKYETSGTFFETDDIGFLNLSNPFSLTPARPLTLFAGLNYRFIPPAPVAPLVTKY